MISGNERDHPRYAYQEVQRQLLPRDPIQLAEETRNSILLLACGVAGIFIFIALSVLCWILYSKHPNNTFLWHALWALLSAGFSVNVTIWGWYARPAVRPRDEPNHLWTVFNYIIAKILVVYLLVESIWLIFYLRIHFDFLSGLNTDESLWEKRNYKGATFEDSWANSRKILWCSIFLSLIGCGVCAFFSYAIKFISPNPYRMDQISLFFILGCTMLSAWFSIYWAEESFEFEKFIEYRTSIHNLSRTIKAFSIVVLAVAGLATVNHILRTRIGYSISAFCFVFLVFSITGTSALVWKDVRNYQLKEQTYSDSTSCAFTMQTIHERDFHQDLCPVGGGHKYLNEGNVCSKHFMVTRWEGGDFSDIRFLNPMCCLTSKYFYIWPFMFLGFWSICLTILVFIAAILSLQLTQDGLEIVTRGELLGAFLIFGLSAGWILYFLVRTEREVMMEKAVGTHLNAYKNPDTTTLPGILQVPREIISMANPATPFIWNNNPNGTVCFSYDPDNMPFNIYHSNASSCNNYSCMVRVALGSYSTKIVSKESNNISQSRIEYRNKFFPHCEGQFDDYITAYGRLEDVQKFLKELQFCTQNFTYMPKIAFYKEQALSNINGFDCSIPSQKYIFESSNLQQPGLATPEPSVLKPQLCLFGFNQPKESCHQNFNCSYFNTTSSRVSFMTLKGRFYYLQEGQERFDSNPGVVARAYSGDKILGDDAYYLFENGEFAIRNIPFFRQSNYVIRLEIHDKSNVFINKTVELILRPPKISEKFLSAGKIRLITKDSQFCCINDTDCQQRQLRLTGNVTVVVNDGSIGMATSSFLWPIEGATVSVVSQHSMTGNPLSMKATSRAGVVFFTNVPYGSYTVVVSKKGYTTESQFFDLQESHLHLRPFLVGSDYSDQDVKLSAAILAPSQDYDLILQFKTDEGLVCEVSPYFKYCGFAAHLNDVKSGMGEENIHVRRLTVATYNAFLRLAPPYNSSCQSYGIISDNHQQHLRVLDWSHLQAASSSCEMVFCGILRLSGVFYSVGRYVDKVWDYLDSNNLENKDTIMRLINFLGSPLFGTSIVNRNTSFVLEDQIVNQIMSDTTLGDELPPIVNPYPPLFDGNVPIWIPEDGWNITNNTSEPNENITLNNSTTDNNTSCSVVPQGAMNCTELTIFISTAPPQSLKVVTRNYTLNYFPLLLVKESSTTGYLQNYSYYTEEQANRTSGTDPSECMVTFSSTHENVTTSTFPFGSLPRNGSSKFSSSKWVTSNRCTNDSSVTTIDIATEKMVELAGTMYTSAKSKRYDNHDTYLEIFDQNKSNSSLESNYSDGSGTLDTSEWMAQYVFDKLSNSSSWLNSSAETSIKFNSTDRNSTFYSNANSVLSNLTKGHYSTYERSNEISQGIHINSESESNVTLRDETYEFYYQTLQLNSKSIEKLANESTDMLMLSTRSEAGTNCSFAGNFRPDRQNGSIFSIVSISESRNAEGIVYASVFNQNNTNLFLYYPTTEDPRPSEKSKSEYYIHNEITTYNGSANTDNAFTYYKYEYEIHPELLWNEQNYSSWYYRDNAAEGGLLEENVDVQIHTNVYNSSGAWVEANNERRVNKTVAHSYQYNLWSDTNIYQSVVFSNISEFFNYTNGSRTTRNEYRFTVVFNPPNAPNYPHNETLVGYSQTTLITWNENNEIIYAKCSRSKIIFPKGSSSPELFVNYDVDPFETTAATVTPDDLAPSTIYYGA